jgi:urease beta subunit
VHYAPADGSAKVPGDYTAANGDLTFNPGQTSKTVTVVIQGDLVNEANETFTVNLTNSTGVAIGVGQGIGSIKDNDPLPQLSISNAPARIEGNANSRNDSFIITLTGATERKVTVHYATADNTATASSDYTAKSGTITFLPGQTSKTVAVAILGDLTVESDETFFVNLTSATNASIVDGQGVGTITNDDGITLNGASNPEGTSSVAL